MYLIAGLGNPGDKYILTRHNVGFLVIDQIIKNLSVCNNINNPNFKSIVIKSSSTLYAKPQTYMNNSGEAISSIARYYDIDLDNIIVIHDDLDLPFGSVKFKLGGGHGGHNGLKSIDTHLSSKEYIRVRVGIGRPIDKTNVANYVLSNFQKDQYDILQDKIIPHIIKAINNIKTNSLQDTQTNFTLKAN
jgi:PTH1 family peptidyl-tRNA hydrolase